ncbi:putative bifunctional inhibitor/plant lipid transfer protein/seed storage helical [Medicago truncatula]|uniref:Lipid transfer protein n=1 Tax=Medicago truncatula TaxID=3880 RepID=G7IAH0_MEDTR|nr:Lipid transfer protein [Medicago truncatula]RHN81634.1 putative bifunctional inhibitor/plant lipid transfer protein/seed storage helical [Medicago truncatula]
MAQVKIGTGLVLVILVMLCAGAPMAPSRCTNVLVNLSPCLDYITGKSSTPTSGCCTQLANVVKSQRLCQVLDGALNHCYVSCTKDK